MKLEGTKYTKGAIRRIACFVLFVSSCLAACVALSRAADSSDAKFLSGLRERRLFELAEVYCADRLRSAERNGAAERELTLELIRTLALHAAHSPPQGRAALLDRARRSAADYLRRAPLPPRAILVRVQDALTPLAQGELGRQEFEAGLVAADQLEPARQALREATALLEALDKELAREIPLRRRTPPRAGELNADELIGLHQDVQRQLARGQRNRALLAGPGSDDRRALLLAAIETLKRPLAQLSDDDPLRPQVQLDQAECLRLAGQAAEAGELAAGFDQEKIAPAVRWRARAELIRVALAQNNLTGAQRLMDAGQSATGQSSAEFDFARFEALLALSGSASATQARQYQEEAAAAAKSIDDSHGPYWGRRADQLLIAALPRGAGASAQLLARKADGLYLKQDFAQAVAAYDDASAAARSAGQTDAAFDLAAKAALALQQRGQHAAAADRLRKLAKELPTHPRAPPAHLLAVWNAAQLAHGQPEAAEFYAALVREHLADWPQAASASQARLWLGKLAELRGDFAAAIDAYRGVPRSSEHFDAAVLALADCWRQRLAKLAAAGQPTAQPLAEALGQLTAVWSGREKSAAWSAAERAAALAQAELILAFEPSRAAAAEQSLRAVLAGAGDVQEEWQLTAHSQLVVALAGQPGREREAEDVLRQLRAASPVQLLAVLEGLAQAASGGTSQSRPKIAAVQLAALKLLEQDRQQLLPAEQLRLSTIEAEALATSGRRDEALAALEKLAQAIPDSGVVHERYAALLLDSNDRSQLEQALAQWRIIASRSQPHGPRWLQAKYSIAVAQLKLGDRERAATLLQYILAVPPGLKGSPWEAKYNELLRQGQQPATAP
ncbi:MAG TPA: hypothetical protein VFB80_20740 [Pirellulaceae bacterium]|nr:hypothetical protein [Pirellulaceae bacterium]